MRFKSYNVLSRNTGWTGPLFAACISVCISCSLIYGFGLGFCMERRVQHEELNECMKISNQQTVIKNDNALFELPQNKTIDKIDLKDFKKENTVASNQISISKTTSKVEVIKILKLIKNASDQYIIAINSYSSVSNPNDTESINLNNSTLKVNPLEINDTSKRNNDGDKEIIFNITGKEFIKYFLQFSCTSCLKVYNELQKSFNLPNLKLNPSKNTCLPLISINQTTIVNKSRPEDPHPDYAFDLSFKSIRCRMVVQDLHMILYLIGVIIGSISCIYVYKGFYSLTSKNALHICHGLALFSSIFLLPNDKRINHRLVMTSRFFHGLSAGFGLVLAPRYLHEISPVIIHSQAIVLHYFFICIGILFGQFSNRRMRFWLFGPWNYAFPILVGTLLLPWLPESPICLVKRNKQERACANLQKLRKCINVQKELDKIDADCQIDVIVEEDSSIPKMLRHLGGDASLRACVLLFSLSILCGYYMFLSFTNRILSLAGLNSSRIRDAAMIFTFIQIVGTISCIFIIRSVNRKSIIRCGALTQLGCLMIFSIVMQMQNELNSIALAQLGMLVMSINVLFYGLGLGPIVYVYLLEVISCRYNLAVLSFCVAIFHLIALFMLLVFPLLMSALGNMFHIMLTILSAGVFAALKGLITESLLTDN
ncbi:hypothetical protein GJ496_006585 [Pomphorhynchus laevis]|nr:hypothetical protein GJ496_006585 [Pomphorhynchus laevis]